VAQGFYALAVALMKTDRDKDGVTDFDELIMGTDPLDDDAVLQLSIRATPVVGEIVLSWLSISNRIYQLEQAADPGGPWQKAGSEMPAAPPLNQWTNTPGATPGFFRLGVRR
jgi:hypothetical protein